MSAVVVAAVLPCSCERDAENVSSGLDDYYYIERMKKLRLAPAYTGDSYRWTVRTASGADSLLSTEREYIFLAQHEGEYVITLSSTTAGADISRRFPLRCFTRKWSIVPIRQACMNIAPLRASLSTRCLSMSQATTLKQ